MVPLKPEMMRAAGSFFILAMPHSNTALLFYKELGEVLFGLSGSIVINAGVPAKIGGRGGGSDLEEIFGLGNHACDSLSSD